ncbi:metallophosphoesterase family protein [Zhaonella formicivorans]|uniref:metallophosphoesterase family protein n=1 Tax=Zhaonella formicivorans TaxID=2528593 RepID=UPI0010EA44DA|nr:DNA repair exonuclease [Zhaonella formicivorans]
MKQVSFVHCSDLHLGCQQFNEIQRWHDFGAAFAQVIDYAVAAKVDFMLIGGDLFHHRSVNAPTLAQAISGLARLKSAGIEAIAIEGNHDKAFYLERDSWMSFLNNQGYLRLLRPVFRESGLELAPYDGGIGSVLEEKGLRIIGLGYLGATTRQRLEEIAEKIKASENFTIVMLHAAVDKLLGQDLAGVKGEVFEKFRGKVDYFALGHIHSRQELGELVFNPGAPECVHLDEAKEGNEKGFYHVTVVGKEKRVNFIPSKRRDVRRYPLDLTGLTEPGQVTAKVLQLLEDSDLRDLDRPIAQINLYGAIAFNSFAIDTNDLAEKVKERFGCLLVEVLNNANLPQLDTGAEFTGFDRNLIERHVLTAMLAEDKPELKEVADQVVELMLRVKNDALAGVDETEIISAVEKLLEKLPLPEAAAGKDRSKGHED